MKINYKIIIISIIILFLVLFFTKKTYENFAIVFNTPTKQFTDCSKITNCSTCAETFGCVYCKTTNKCVSDLSKNILCPGEDTAYSKETCGQDTSTATTLYKQRTYGDCSGVSDCKDCLSSPGCYWCDTKKKCISSIGVYDTCKDDPVIKNSFSECDATNSLQYNANDFNIPRTSTSIPQISEKSLNILNNLPNISNTRLVTSIPNYNSDFDDDLGSLSSLSSQPVSSSTTLADTMSTIIPIVALSKDSNGNLSESSLQTIIDSMKRDGYNFSTKSGKQNALQVIENQKNILKQQYKNNIKDYVSNSLDYISDGSSLNRAKDVNLKLKELDDVSRYIQSMKIEGFIEGFLDKEIIINENLIEENNSTKWMTQWLWLGNIIALSAFLYVR